MGVQSRFARGQRWFCDPFLVRCSSVLPRCNAGGSGSPSTVPELPQKHRDQSPQLKPHAWGFSLCCGYRQKFPWPSAHTPSTTGNCSGSYCNTSRSIYISSARNPKLSNNRGTVLTSPVFVDVVCPLTSHFILSCHCIKIVLRALCDSWLYIQSEAASNHAQPKDACYSSPRKSKYKN